MKHLTRILAAFDGSAPSRVAFARALDIARAHGAGVTVVMAVPPEERLRERAAERAALAEELREQANAAGVPLDVSVQHGDPAPVILAHAESRQPDLIALGTRRRSGVRWRAGASVSETVALQAAQPVLIVPAPRVAPAAQPPFGANILAAVDLEGEDRRIVDLALSLAAPSGGRVTIVHVLPGRAAPELSGEPGTAAHEDRHAPTREAWERVRALAPEQAVEGPAVHVRLVSGPPVAEIARVAAEVGAQLIVAGVTRRSTLARLLFGATAARVLRSSGLPVVAVPLAGMAGTVDREDLARAA